MTSAKQINAMAFDGVKRQTMSKFLQLAKAAGTFELDDIELGVPTTYRGSLADQLVRAGNLTKSGKTYTFVKESMDMEESVMELSLFNSLLLIEAVAAPKEKVKPAKEPVIEPKTKAEPAGDGDGLDSAKKAFIFKTKFDQYDNLEQTEDQNLRREMKRVYAIFGREHERSVVYGINSGNDREFKRLARMLGISTDGEVTLERVKRAGFTLAGRIGTKRLMKRGDFVVSLVGPNDDQTPIAFYTSKPVEKVAESQADMFGGTDHGDIIADLEAEAQRLIDKHASQAEVNEFKKKMRDSLGHDSIHNDHLADLSATSQRIVKKLRAAGYKGA